MTTRPVEEPPQTLDRLQEEVSELRASRKRLVLAVDDERRQLERALHEGIQQELVALAVKLQQATRIADTGDGDATRLLDEMGRDLQRAIGDLRELAQRLYPARLEAGGLAAALRVLAVDVDSDLACAPEAAGTIYRCCLEALERGAGVTVRNEGDTLVLEVVEDTESGVVEAIRDRVEALGGRVVAGKASVSAFLPLSG